MRLLFLSTVFPSPLAPTRGLYNRALLEALAEEHEVRVIAPVSWTLKWRRRAGAIPFSESSLKVVRPTFYYPPGMLHRWHGTFLWLAARSFVGAACRSFRPEAVVSYWAHPDGEAARRAGTKMGVPMVLIVGGSDVLLLGNEPTRRRSIIEVLRSADGILAVGRDLRRRVIDLGIPPEQVFVFRRGVSDRFTPGDKDAARVALGLPRGTPTLLWAGNMVPVKGVHFLLDACARLVREGLPLHLCLVGDGPLRGDLEARAASSELAGHVRFAGSVGHDQLPDWYRAADLMVLPSLSEGVPNVLLESLACGTPFVASRVGGIPDLALEPGRDLVSPGDPAALAKAIRDRLEEEPTASGWAARFRWRDSAALLARAVDQVAGPSPSGGSPRAPESPESP